MRTYITTFSYSLETEAENKDQAEDMAMAEFENARPVFDCVTYPKNKLKEEKSK